MEEVNSKYTLFFRQWGPEINNEIMWCYFYYIIVHETGKIVHRREGYLNRTLPVPVIHRKYLHPEEPVGETYGIFRADLLDDINFLLDRFYDLRVVTINGAAFKLFKGNLTYGACIANPGTLTPYERGVLTTIKPPWVKD